MSEPLRFRGEAVLVTGAGSGIGRAIALELARQGLAVGVNDAIAEAAASVCEEILGDGGRALPLPADVSVAADVGRMAARATAEWGVLDVLVNNAGFGQYAPFEEISEAQWDRMVAVHLKGAFNCIQAVLPGMKKRAYGRIVLMSSVAGMTGTPSHAHYSMVKAGLIGLAKALAKEVARDGITVNALAPGMIETPFLSATTEEIKDMYRSRTPLGRVGLPEDVAGVCSFLVSEGADYITGQVISPNGGYLI
jgi:3-oxoacyl-[acyl-carrier protein] reductase